MYLNGKEISTVEFSGKIISYIYTSGKLVWQAIKSCFGAGIWNNLKNWVNEEPYKN